VSSLRDGFNSRAGRLEVLLHKQHHTKLLDEQTKQAIKQGLKIGAAVVSPLVVLFVVVLIGAGYFVPGTGFGERVINSPPNTIVQPAKTLWDWMQLLLVPVAVAAAGLWYTGHQGRIQRETAERGRKQDLKIAKRRRKQDLEIAQDRARESVLENYFDKIEALQVSGKLSPPPIYSASNVAPVTTTSGEIPGAPAARARTLTALRQLDATRKGHLMKFLVEARLVSGDHPIIDLSHADLRGADLSLLELNGAILQEADLTGARLSFANLQGANLFLATLNNANLTDTRLQGANLRSAKLLDAELGVAQLAGADLSGADLSNARLGFADLKGADLQYAKLEGATLKSAKYNSETKWPGGGAPSGSGATYEP
jgi:hypothetical protein